MQTSIPCVLMRGGSSRGLYFRADDLPDAPDMRDRVLLSAMGSPDPRQIDGVGGGASVTSKVAIVSRSDHPWADVDYLFAQVAVDRPAVDTGPSCGNILSGVAPFAIDAGLVCANGSETTVRIRNVNTGTLIEAVVQTPNGAVEYDGATAIDGVPGTAAPVSLTFLEPVGSKTGRLFPTGNPIDRIDGVDVTCIDAATPMVLVAAESLGKSGFETPEELDGDECFLQRLERLRCAASRRMGLGDGTGSVLPKVGLVASPRHGGTICSRYFVPDRCHPSYAVTGAISVAAAAAVEGTVVHRLASPERDGSDLVSIEHPAGRLDVNVAVSGAGARAAVARATVVRTARPIMTGVVHVPRHAVESTRESTVLDAAA